MSKSAPHFLLLTRADSSDEHVGGGQWSFVLERIGDQNRIEIVDVEPNVRGERLDLLAVVRGLEALEMPARVTLITPSNYVGRGFRNGLKIWSVNGFQWERFGELAPIKNQDLWKRVARAMSYHTIDCRVWQFGQFNNLSRGFANSSASGQSRLASPRPFTRPSGELQSPFPDSPGHPPDSAYESAAIVVAREELGTIATYDHSSSTILALAEPA